MDRRSTARTYDALLPGCFPLKLTRSAILVEFAVDGGLDTRVSPRRMLAWLRSMPSYRAGVPLHFGGSDDAGLSFDKCAELIELVDAGRSMVYATRRPFTTAQRAFLAAPRVNLLLELGVAPGPAEGEGEAGFQALELIRSAAGLDQRGVHWLVGPLDEDSEEGAARLLTALPLGSRLTLQPRARCGDPGAAPLPLGAAALARLESLAHARGLTVTGWRCRGGVGRIGKGFFDVDRLTGQLDLARRAHDLITCAGCPSRTQCHGPLDEAALHGRLDRELQVVGLGLAAPPVRTGPRAYRLQADQPTAGGDQAYLSHALGQPVAISFSTTAPAHEAVPAAVLRRWYAAGFLPVTELNAAAEKVLEDLARRSATPRPATPPARCAS